MRINHCKELSGKKLKAIIQKLYMQVPRIMQHLAPNGWKHSDYHQQIQQQQRADYDQYLNELLQEKQQKNSPFHQHEDDTTYLQEYAIEYEDYHGFQFPCLDQDEGEVFCILIQLLHDLTLEGMLISNPSQYSYRRYYYIQYDDLSKIAVKIACQNKLILKEDASITYLGDIHVLLEEMDLFHCMLIVFEILQTENFQWHHIDTELQYILIAHHEYHYLAHCDMPFMERCQRQEEILDTIQDLLIPYHCEWLDPLDFIHILSLYNRRKTNYYILAYLHSYHTLPSGYPYEASDYLYHN